MGEVWRARDHRKNRIVAIKIISDPGGVRDEEARTRFYREAAIAAGLTCPYIIPVHDYGEIDSTVFIEMPEIEGEDLAEMLHRVTRMVPTDATSVLAQVAEAIDTAHAAGLIHRDVKPANIILAARRVRGVPHAYLTDFGVARYVGSTRITASGLAIGTPAYMAPEQFAGNAVPASDIYALGCILFETLTGRRPFDGGDPVTLMTQHLSAPPPTLSTVAPDLPHSLDDVCIRALAKDPTTRYRRAGDLVDDACLAMGSTNGRSGSGSAIGPNVFASSSGAYGVHLASDIPLSTINALRSRCAVPQDETILAAVQLGWMRKWRNAIVFGQRAIYARGIVAVGCVTIPYELLRIHGYYFGYNGLMLGKEPPAGTRPSPLAQKYAISTGGMNFDLMWSLSPVLDRVIAAVGG